MREHEMDRRTWLRFGALAGTGVLLSACRAEEAELSPTEDLMREHGVLDRVLIVYDEVATRLESNDVTHVDVARRGAEVVRRFLEDYHAGLEERHVFPRLASDARYTSIVSTLKRQHAAGRLLTDTLLREAKTDVVTVPEGRARVATTLRRFTRMYRPHEAREETVIFPALRAALSKRELEDLGSRFENEEERRFGRNGFSAMVERVAGLEEDLGIHDLGHFTPG